MLETHRTRVITSHVVYTHKYINKWTSHSSLGFLNHNNLYKFYLQWYSQNARMLQLQMKHGVFFLRSNVSALLARIESPRSCIHDRMNHIQSFKFFDTTNHSIHKSSHSSNKLHISSLLRRIIHDLSFLVSRPSPFSIFRKHKIRGIVVKFSSENIVDNYREIKALVCK